MPDDRSLPSTADHIGEAAGGISGVVAGAAIGISAGPLGVLLGGIAGAIGGWWTGRALAEAAEDITEADDAHYRSVFERAPERAAAYEDARRAYYLGHVAAANPDYATRQFADVEGELARGWTAGGSPATWSSVRSFAALGFARGNDRRRTGRRSDRRSAPSADVSPSGS
jgi:hypothetical protein